MSHSSAVALAVLIAGLASPFRMVHAQSLETISSSRQLAGEERLDVDVAFGIGNLHFSPDETGALYRSEMVFDGNLFEPEIRYDPMTNALDVQVGSFQFGHGFDHSEKSKQRLTISVTRDVPVRLNVEFGAGEGDIELGGLRLAEAEIKTGASSTAIRFSQPNRITCRFMGFEVGAAEFRVDGLGNARCERFDLAGGAGELTLDFSGDWGAVTRARGEIGLGLGSLTLRFPDDLGVSVDVSRFLASFDREGFTHRGGKYYSDNYDSAAVRLDLDVTAALGTIEVVWIGVTRADR